MVKVNVSLDNDVRDDLFELVPPGKRSYVINQVLRKELLRQKREWAAVSIQNLRGRSAILTSDEIVLVIGRDRAEKAR